MKVYISADIEGVTGITHRDETLNSHKDYIPFRQRMTAEVAAACEGALQAGATSIWIKDAHGSGRNLIADQLPRESHLIRGWSGHPFGMVQELDTQTEALVVIGYHSAATSGGNPLSHTFTGLFHRIELNGERMSEFRCISLTARDLGVPTVFISGDSTVCDEAQELEPSILTVATQRGVGNSTISMHPHVALEQIRSGVAQAIEARKPPPPMPESFCLDIRFRHHSNAYRFSFYPGAQSLSDDTVRVESNTWFEILRAIRFAR